MAIVDIEAGSKASSKQLNDNFHYLQDIVGELSIKIDGSEDTVDSKIATLKNTLTNQINDLQTNIETEQETLQNNIDTLADGVGKSVAYVVESYVQNDAGYFVFSDGTILQWGHYKITATSGAKDTKITFLKPFTTTGYIIVDSAYYPEQAGDKVNYYGCIGRNTTDMTYRVYQERWSATGNLWWMCIGK